MITIEYTDNANWIAFDFNGHHRRVRLGEIVRLLESRNNIIEERNRLRRERDADFARAKQAKAERDAALDRAERAEKERDAALDRAERTEREYEDRDWNDLKCRAMTAETQSDRLNAELANVREERDTFEAVLKSRARQQCALADAEVFDPDRGRCLQELKRIREELLAAIEVLRA
jgi:hypothetical protein